MDPGPRHILSYFSLMIDLIRTNVAWRLVLFEIYYRFEIGPRAVPMYEKFRHFYYAPCCRIGALWGRCRRWWNREIMYGMRFRGTGHWISGVPWTACSSSVRWMRKCLFVEFAHSMMPSWHVFQAWRLHASLSRWRWPVQPVATTSAMSHKNLESMVRMSTPWTV